MKSVNLSKLCLIYQVIEVYNIMLKMMYQIYIYGIWKIKLKSDVDMLILKMGFINIKNT